MITFRFRRAALTVPLAGQPGSYTSVGINNGTPGAIGPDGRPTTAATPPAWSAPGYQPPPAPAPAPNDPAVAHRHPAAWSDRTWNLRGHRKRPSDSDGHERATSGYSFRRL